MNRWLKNILSRIKEFIRDYDRKQRHRSTELLEWETEELINIFGLILFGFFTGYPSAPMNITLDLLPYMEEDLETLLKKIDLAHDPMAELFSLLDIG